MSLSSKVAWGKIGFVLLMAMPACNWLLPVTVTPTPVEPTPVAACPAGVQLDMSDNGEAVTLKLGEALVIRLDENRTTGYSWQVENINSQVLKPGEQIPFGYGEAPGSGGQVDLCFATVGVGTAKLSLAYRQGTSDQSAATTFEVSVTVKK